MVKNIPFKGTEWLELETALETIGNMIAYQAFRLNNVLQLERSNSELVADIRGEIKRLSQELKLCYDKNHNQEVIAKAYSIYAPQLKHLAAFD